LYCDDGHSLEYNLYFQQAAKPDTVQMSLGTWWHGSDQENSFRINRVYVTYAAEPHEHFFGFGEQFTYLDMQGKRVPIWVPEQGVGRGEQPLTFFANITNGGAGGNAFTTYAPMPFYMTDQMHALYLDNYARSVFDLRKPGRVQVQVDSSVVYFNILDGNSPAEIIQAFTENNRMSGLPEWVYAGAIAGMQGGTEKVKQVYEELKKRDVPLTAFWLQDWVGQRTTSFGKQLWWNWELDQDRYPDWEGLLDTLKHDHVQVMLYVNPNLVDVSDKPNADRNLFKEALENGYLVKRQDGTAYLMQNTSFDYGMVDLTNPEAVDWQQGVIADNMIRIGASGWMADFGESLPYDSQPADEMADPANRGDAAVVHNRYPVEWAGLNRWLVTAFPAELGPSQTSLVFFTRSGYRNSPLFSTLFWEGDQLVDWSAQDGIKSAVTGLNTSGLSGMAFNHSDIGGYTTITNPLLKIHRSRELLYRWMEMNAFTLIFRTHEGNQPANNIQFYTDDETLDTFARWSKVYAALFDYRKDLVQEAEATGLPVVRHPFLQYPTDPQTWKITYQEFMLGPDFLIAPITDEGATDVTVYLPKGTWVHLWTDKVYEGGQYVTIPAPLGQPGVFYIQGSAWGNDLKQQLTSQALMP
jgi:alpha-glucosidase (family GH31 glycosyl hydrolase)